MKRNHWLGMCVIAVLLCVGGMAKAAAAEPTQEERRATAKARVEAEAKEGFVPLFNGKDLTGWEGDSAIWSVKNRMIVGRGDKITVNTFLCTTREYGDYILRLRMRLVNNTGNTGVQVRSARWADWPTSHRMKGFQADYAETYWGSLYDEGRRGMLVQAKADEVKKAVRPAGWNDYEIRCEGNKITLTLNGVKTAEYEEKDAAIPAKGFIALQVHAGFDMEVQFRNIRIKELGKK